LQGCERASESRAKSVGEISIRDTVHADAQYPNQHTLGAFEDESDDIEEARTAFVSALTAAAFGLAATAGIDYGWNSFESAFKNGKFLRRGENNRHGFSQIVHARVEDRGSAPGSCDRHRRADAWFANCLATGTR
jgi:hypothetical protein